jgi:hypothetical protein
MDGPSHPLTVDTGLIWASAMVVLDSVRRGLARAVAGRGGCLASASRPRSADVAYGPGAWPDRRRGGCLADGGTGRLLRTANDDHSWASGDHGQRLSRDRASSGRDAACTTCPSRRRSSPTTLRPVACHRFALLAKLHAGTAVIGVAVVAAVVRTSMLTPWCNAHGETEWTARLIPLTVYGLIWSSSMARLDSQRPSDASDSAST